MKPDNRLPALTLQKPWAGLVVHEYKGYENRAWRPGDWLLGRELVIHGGRTIDPNIDMSGLSGERIEKISGEGLMGVVVVKGWIDSRTGLGRMSEGGELRAASALEIKRARRSPWTIENQIWWVLTERRALPKPIPARGRPGLFYLTAEQEKAVREALR